MASQQPPIFQAQPSTSGIGKVVLGLRFIGLGNALRALRYTLQRARLDRRHRPRPVQGPRTPGRALSAEALPSGARVRFEETTLEIRFLAPDLVHLIWGVPSRLSYGVAKTAWSGAPVRLETHRDGWTLHGESLHVSVGADGRVRFVGGHDEVLREEAPPEREGDNWVHRAALASETCVYGLGERANRFDLRPGRYRLWNHDPGGTYGPGEDPLYLAMPVYFCVQRSGAYLAFYENSWDGSVTLGHDAEVRFDGGHLGYYIIVGAPAQVLERFSELTGRASLPPRWALGYHVTRWLAPPWGIGRVPGWHAARPGYDHMAELRRMADGFAEHRLPLSAVHIDDWYWQDFRLFTHDAERFPGLAPYLAELRERGVRSVSIVQAAFKRDRSYDLYVDGERQGIFCKRPDGRTLHFPLWCGWSAYPDFTNPEARDWWKSHYPRWDALGFDGFWHDMNEPAAFVVSGEPTLPRCTRHDLDGRGGDHREAHNGFALLMNRAGHEALREQRRERRPWLLSRSGWVGIQRYAWTWTGDVESSWAALRQTVGTVLGLGLSGQPYAGPDVGGFSGHPSTELYVRWFQLASFLPFFRTHSAYYLPRREPWEWGSDALEILRAQLEMRYRLLPYLYTLAWQAACTGAPLVRPIFWSHASDAALWRVDDAFLLGDDLLVAPVVEEGATERSVMLPAGGWYGLFDGAYYEGGKQVTVAAPLERIPVFVRAGVVLPTEEEGSLVLRVYRPSIGASPIETTLYDDAGDGYGPFRIDRFRLLPAEAGYELTWTSEGDHLRRWSDVELELHGFRAGRVSADQRELALDRGSVRVGRFAQLLIPG